jgi:hypothetical protein
MLQRWGWPRWWRAFGAELVPVIPPDAESDTIEKHLRGKVPGMKGANGKWHGLTGKLTDFNMTEAIAQQCYEDGACIGLQGRKYPGIDLDTSDLKTLDILKYQVEMMLGRCPWRGRGNSPRMLGMFYSAQSIRKRRLDFRLPTWKKGDPIDAIEWLGAGCYYNVEGMHPSGKPYFWTEPHPCELVMLGIIPRPGTSH